MEIVIRFQVESNLMNIGLGGPSFNVFVNSDMARVWHGRDIHHRISTPEVYQIQKNGLLSGDMH